jgi:hypothetical protein
MSGEVGVLNVGAGDIKLSFDPSNPAEVIRAKRMVKDMLRRGYALLVGVGTGDDGRPIYQRALDFDEERCEYIIADFDPEIAAETDRKEREDGGEKVAAAAPSGNEGGAKGKAKRGQKRVPAASAPAVAVAHSAGG